MFVEYSVAFSLHRTMNSKPESGPTGNDGSNLARTSSSMTTSDVVTKMDREQTPPPR